MQKIKLNDEVVVTTGKDNGKRGKVVKILATEGKVVVGGLNVYKRHLKRKSEKEQSQIVTLEKPMNISNTQVICPHCNKAVRVGFETKGEEKLRVCKKCKQNFK
jgi:large subunit ribosomal protein L24